MVKIMENPMNKWDDLGGLPPLFLEGHPYPPISTDSEVKLRQVAAKTDVEGRAGALSVELRLGSLHLDVGTGTLVCDGDSGWMSLGRWGIPRKFWQM